MARSFPKISFLTTIALLGVAGGSWGYSGVTAPIGCSGSGSTTCKIISASGVSLDSNGDPIDVLAARAIFEFNSSTSSLFVTLSNISPADVSSNPSVLTALLFNLKYTNGDAVALSPLQAAIAPISGTGLTFDADTVYDAGGTPQLDATCAGTVNDTSGTPICSSSATNIGGEWVHSTISHAGFTQGISSTGLSGIFGVGMGTMFGTTNLSGPAWVDGPQYGITSSADNLSTGNPSGPVTKDSVQFKLNITNLAGHTLELNKSGALSVGFQYGTSTTDTLLPTPGTMALVVVGLLAVGVSRVRLRPLSFA